MQNFGPKMQFFGPKSIFFRKSSKFFVTIMTGQQKDNIFVLTPLHGGPRGGRRGPFLARKSAFFYATHETPIFSAQTDRTGPIISPPYPEVTLDNFGFLVGAHLALRQSILWLADSQKWPFRGSKMQFLGQNLFFWRHRPIFFYFNDRTPKMFYVESGE